MPGYESGLPSMPQVGNADRTRQDRTKNILISAKFNNAVVFFFTLPFFSQATHSLISLRGFLTNAKLNLDSDIA